MDNIAQISKVAFANQLMTSFNLMAKATLLICAMLSIASATANNQTTDQSAEAEQQYVNKIANNYQDVNH
jgi:hypothetical protein